MLKPAIVASSLVAAIVGPAFAQLATPQEMGTHAGNSKYATLHLQCNLGSFKIIDGEGRCEVSFSGTVLVSGVEGTVTPVGSIVKEFDDMDREVYHGTGSLVVDGKWRGMQWFGSDMNATWYGSGIVRLIGEFDKDLKTGLYWYDDPTDKGAWPTNVSPIFLPRLQPGAAPGIVPRKRGEGGN